MTYTVRNLNKEVRRAQVYLLLLHQPPDANTGLSPDKIQAIPRSTATGARGWNANGGFSAAVRCHYMIEYHAAILRHAGDTDRDYTTLNTLSEGMQIESDIRPPA